MTQHRSLKGSSKIQMRRSVLKRYERLEVLQKSGKRKAEDSVYGLPKTKSYES